MLDGRREAYRPRLVLDGAFRFVTPDGRSFDSTLPGYTQPLGDLNQLVATHEEQGLHIERHTAATRWDGESYDHALAIEVLLRRCGITYAVTSGAGG
ncbi:MAG TPA: hypothetical protein VGD45_04765 [Steroidobacter sp.]|uniref:hypothetical protein n=1 Tax=Steroidobacter sp. TaxID=1978227 RepID=UPI002EDA597F